MTTNPSYLARLLAGGCAVALTLAACGSGDDAIGDGGAPTSTTAVGVAGSAAPSTAVEGSGADAIDGADTTDADSDDESDDGDSEKAARWLSPLDELLGFGVEQSAEERAEGDQLQRQVEQLIADCMSAQGFEYIAVDWSTIEASSGPWDLPADEFARQYGYGITTIDRLESSTSDPNAAIVEAMTVPQKQAYYQALYGDTLSVDETGDLVKPQLDALEAAAAPDTESCSAKASAEVFGEAEGGAAGAENDAFAPLQQEMSALYERIENDARVVGARTAWSDCMADAGYPGYTDIYDASTDVSDRATEVLGERMDPAAADPAALQELRTYEIAVATADLACRVDYDAAHREAQTELEQAFIDDNRAELEQYRDAIAAGDVGVG